MSKSKNEGARRKENERANEGKQSPETETETIFDYVHLSDICLVPLRLRDM